MNLKKKSAAKKDRGGERMCVCEKQDDRVTGQGFLLILF